MNQLRHMKLSYYLYFILTEFFNNFLIFIGIFKRKLIPHQRLDGQTVLITGGNRGIGKETAILCASLGAEVIIACRDVSSGNLVAKEIIKSGYITPQVIQMDLSSIDSIIKSIKYISETRGKIDILINNAGIVSPERKVNQNGIESTIQTNYIGSFILTESLLPYLNKSNDPRIVFVSSIGHYLKKFNFDDFFEQKDFSTVGSYGHSKMAALMYIRTLTKTQPNIRVYAIDPGCVLTDIVKVSERLETSRKWFSNIFLRKTTESASTILGPVFLPKHTYDREQFYFGDAEPKEYSDLVLNDNDCYKLYSMTKDRVSYLIQAQQLNNSLKSLTSD